MRFAYAGFDRWCGVFDALVASGWEPVELFTLPVDHQLDFNDELVSQAIERRLPVQISRITEDDLCRLGTRDCDALVVAGYPWRVPDWQAHLRYAINFHPAPLPEGRGPFPTIQALLEGRREWGVSCHQIAADFDTGDVLATEHFPVEEDECHETLQLKSQMAARRLAAEVAGNFRALWGRKKPQGSGSYWPRIDDNARTLDFSRPVAELMRVVRALGLHECIAPLDGKYVYVRRAQGWRETHAHAPGTVVHRQRRWTVVAAADGYVALIEWSPLNEATRGHVGP
jgi:methionyl-tRNA formyltransferase